MRTLAVHYEPHFAGDWVHVRHCQLLGIYVARARAADITTVGVGSRVGALVPEHAVLAIERVRHNVRLCQLVESIGVCFPTFRTCGRARLLVIAPASFVAVWTVRVTKYEEFAACRRSARCSAFCNRPEGSQVGIS